MTGPSTAKFKSVWYVLAPSPSPMFTNQVVFIGVSAGDIEFTGPGKLKGTHNMAFNLPTTEADGDGFPDAGQAPSIQLPPILSTDTRMVPGR